MRDTSKKKIQLFPFFSFLSFICKLLCMFLFFLFISKLQIGPLNKLGASTYFPMCLLALPTPKLTILIFFPQKCPSRVIFATLSCLSCLFLYSPSLTLVMLSPLPTLSCFLPPIIHYVSLSLTQASFLVSLPYFSLFSLPLSSSAFSLTH